jgi:hypothetical protein
VAPERFAGRWQAKVRVDETYHAAPTRFDVKQSAENQWEAIEHGTWTPPVKKKAPMTFAGR